MDLSTVAMVAFIVTGSANYVRAACGPGFSGINCTTPCNDGWWGVNCTGQCGKCYINSTEPGPCNKSSGVCDRGCAPGYFEDVSCTNLCKPLLWGRNCSNTCGNCYNHQPCQPSNGACISGCQPGWQGSQCYEICSDGYYGQNCMYKCGHCHLSSPICNKQDGSCRNGCDTGWLGINCMQECSFGTFGDRCENKCGHCYNNATCNHYSGECQSFLNNSCQAGFQAPFCNQDCPNGTYGPNCQSCGACNITQTGLNVCNKTTGECLNGCLNGYNGNDKFCRTPCDDGWWGVNCIGQCGKCYINSTEPGPCNKSSGVCDNGCAPGYFEDVSCTNLCKPLLWGRNCSNTCGNCYNHQPCQPSNGACISGCQPGWQGSRCNKTCATNTYGKDCQNQCGQCANGSANCDSITGVCAEGCIDGYIDSICSQPCQPGFYGKECQTQCPVNCRNGTCSNSDGSCVCNNGWMGNKCSESCAYNHYGSLCQHVCGNCATGTTCRQDDGYCAMGCQPEWSGYKCDAKKIIEVLKKSYGDVIGGVIGGVIALALVITFSVWIISRYRNDKSIHISALASSIHRMSIRGSQSLRRSIQRLSMRGRQRSDNEHLAKNAQAPSTTNGHRGHKQTRMYACVHLQSNVIHYDDFPRIYLQLQEAVTDGRTMLYDAFQSFLAQRPQDHSTEENGASGHTNSAYYNAADVKGSTTFMGLQANKIPAFLPLGSNLSGFLLVNILAVTEDLWNHLQIRQIEIIISIGKEASYEWQPGTRLTIGNDVVECINVQLYSSHKESKLTVQRRGQNTRRTVRHLECLCFTSDQKYPLVPNLMAFVERFLQLHQTQRERTVIVNYVNLHENALLFTLVASSLEILLESKRVDILRTVSIGGKATVKCIRTFDSFKFLHDVIFHYITSRESKSTSI